eukprot:5195966-Prymnesium_polylepis.1
MRPRAAPEAPRSQRRPRRRPQRPPPPFWSDEERVVCPPSRSRVQVCRLQAAQQQAAADTSD